MNLPANKLYKIFENTTCPWTRGYIESFMEPAIGFTGKDCTAFYIMERYRDKEYGKLHAIKAIRNEFGLTLRDAKYTVDCFWNDETKICWS